MQRATKAYHSSAEMYCLEQLKSSGKAKSKLTAEAQGFEDKNTVTFSKPSILKNIYFENLPV